MLKQFSYPVGTAERLDKFSLTTNYFIFQLELKALIWSLAKRAVIRRFWDSLLNPTSPEHAKHVKMYASIENANRLSPHQTSYLELGH